ncbi:MAG TPA: AI-2E family transporter [Chitinophagaceae bacterium]
MERYIDNSRLKQVGYLALLVGLGWVIFGELSVYIPSLLGAVTFYVIMRKTMDRLVYKRKWKRGAAAAALMGLSFLIVLVPIWVLVTMLASKLGYAVSHSQEVLNTLNRFVTDFEHRYKIELLSEQNFQQAASYIANALPRILGATFSTLLAIVLMYFLLYFMLIRSRELENYLYEYIPLKDDNINWIAKDLNMLVYNNALAVPLIALLQGIVGLVGYLIFGIPDPWFWFVITAITSMLPFVGAAAAYVPLAIYMFSTGPSWKGTAVLLWGFLVIGLVDNVFRIIIQKRWGDVHPLITAFGVLIGINLFGFVGLIFGPIVIAMFLLLIKIYINEFATRRSTRQQIKGE